MADPLVEVVPDSLYATYRIDSDGDCNLTLTGRLRKVIDVPIDDVRIKWSLRDEGNRVIHGGDCSQDEPFDDGVLDFSVSDWFPASHLHASAQVEVQGHCRIVLRTPKATIAVSTLTEIKGR